MSEAATPQEDLGDEATVLRFEEQRRLAQDLRILLRLQVDRHVVVMLDDDRRRKRQRERRSRRDAGHFT